MFTWMQYQEDILFDKIDRFLADDLNDLKFSSKFLTEIESLTMELLTTEITGRKYQTVSTDEVVAQQKHQRELDIKVPSKVPMILSLGLDICEKLTEDEKQK